MQDIHMLGTGSGGGGRIFGAGIDRRLRTQNHQQALKCPRCDSLNTKFCYYNNYNLSQPRHFCKGCRRYWTKGGVLRNVPVGGGCRKAKRSAKPKQPPSAVATVAAEPEDNSNSSSESSSLTNTTTTAAAEVISGGSSSNSCPALFNFAAEDQIFVPQIANTSFDQAHFIDHASDGGGSMFPEIGRFTEMMTSPADIGFTVADVSAFRSENQKNGEDNRRSDEVQQMHDLASGGYLDQTVQIESGNRISNVDVAGVEWQSGGVNNYQDEGIFDLTGTVDQAYWSQPQWPDHHSDHSTFHYLP